MRKILIGLPLSATYNTKQLFGSMSYDDQFYNPTLQLNLAFRL